MWGKGVRRVTIVQILWEFASWDRGLLRQLIGSHVLLCQHRLSELMSKGWAPRTKGFHLIYPCKQLQKQKARSNPYMVIFNFIGYFTLVLCDLLHVQISQVVSLCYAILTSLLLSQNSGLDCFLLILLSATQTLCTHVWKWKKDTCWNCSRKEG
jgi:hypothetical protein